MREVEYFNDVTPRALIQVSSHEITPELLSPQYKSLRNAKSRWCRYWRLMRGDIRGDIADASNIRGFLQVKRDTEGIFGLEQELRHVQGIQAEILEARAAFNLDGVFLMDRLFDKGDHLILDICIVHRCTFSRLCRGGEYQAYVIAAETEGIT